MKIKNIKLQNSHLPLKEPFTTALRSVKSIDEVIIILKSESYIGLGSAPATLAVTGDDLEKIYSDLKNKVIPAFLDYALDDYEIIFKKLLSLDICKSAQTAMDIALHDLLAKETKKPLYSYLNGQQRPLQTLYTISINTPQKMLLQAQKVFKEGFRKLKIKLDENLNENIRRVRLLHKELPDAELFLDINQAFDLTQAKSFINSMEDLPIKLLEQPLKANDLQGMQELTALNSIPILADETVFSYSDALKAIETKACHYINIKLMKCGGIYEAKKILELCQKNGIQCMMGSMLESGISVTAALHLALAFNNVIFTDLDGPTLASESFIQGGIVYNSMHISCNKALGLGIDL